MEDHDRLRLHVLTQCSIIVKVRFSVQPTFIIYIIDLPKNKLQSLVNIYAEDTAVYGCTSRTLDD